MKWYGAAAALVVGLVFSGNAVGQNFNASVGGFAQDTTQAFIPGVTITATNTQTGVVATAVTNESGAYNIPSLLPGTYKLSAELPGFRTQVFNDVQFGQRRQRPLQLHAGGRRRRSSRLKSRPRLRRCWRKRRQRSARFCQRSKFAIFR